MYRPKTDNILAVGGILVVLMLYDWLEQHLSVGSFRDLPILGEGDLYEVKGLVLFGLLLIAVVLIVKVLRD